MAPARCLHLCETGSKHVEIEMPSLYSLLQMTRYGIREVPVPGTRCPTCAKAGREVWVIPGRNCGYCGTPCDNEEFVHYQ